MGRYIAFTADYIDEVAISEVFRSALIHPKFRPRSLGAIDIGEPNTRWFLSGFGLDGFVAAFNWRKTIKSSSICIDDSFSGAEYREYMEYLSGLIYRKGPATTVLSTFEQLDKEAGVTFLSSPTLIDLSITAHSKWSNESQKSSSTLHGTIKLAANGSANKQWTNAYRFLLSNNTSEGTIRLAPFVCLHADRRGKSVTAPRTITVFSESTAWLHGSKTLAGDIDNDQADENLATLVSVAELLLLQKSVPVRTTLSVESQTFRRDLERINGAFSHLL